MRTTHPIKDLVMALIFTDIAKGLSAKQSIFDNGITEQTFYRWIREDKALLLRYQNAKAQQAERYQAVISEQLQQPSKRKAWALMWHFGRLKLKRNQTK
jgi:hypothetical protein